jgi:hypothetical protein
LKRAEPFKTVLSGNRAAIAKLTVLDLEKIIITTLTGMTTDEFDVEVKKWLATAKDPRWKRPYTELTYQPMQEVMSYLRANGYKTFIVTGFGQDFVRRSCRDASKALSRPRDGARRGVAPRPPAEHRDWVAREGPLDRAFAAEQS